MRCTILLSLVLVAGLAGCTARDPGDTDRDAHNTGNNGEVIAALEEAGSDLSQPHPLEFFIYFDERADADAAAKALAGRGYGVEIEEEKIEGEWLLVATRESEVTEASVDALEAEIVAVADPAHGVYDGWETAVVE
jgi:regulator of RNase E activity RraB